MNTTNFVASLAAIILFSGAAFSTPALSAEGQGWDVFNSGLDEPIHVPKTASASATTGKGWDAFNSGQGERIHVSQSVQSSGDGWDAFRTGMGDKF